MKIRKGFVTNSSSYSSAVISIESKELAALLSQYKELFEDGNVFCMLDLDEKSFGGYWDEQTDDWCREVPKTLDEVLDSLIYAIERDGTGEQAEALVKELNARKQELTASLRKVTWSFENDSYDEFEPGDGEKERNFTYNRRSKKTGGAGVYKEK